MSTDGRCATCKWWDPKASGFTGYCVMTTVNGNRDEPRGPQFPDSKATVYEYGSYGGVLLTAYDFGCVQYELKDDTP